MSDASWAWLTGAAICALFDWVAVGAGNKKVEYATKPTTIVFLIGGALALDARDGVQLALFVLALAFSLGGDIFLMLEERFFVFGLGSFLVAHLLYIGGFAAGDVSAGSTLVWFGALVIVGAWPSWMVVRGATRKERRLQVPVITYVCVITTMFAFAGGSKSLPAIVGAGLFFASDTMIGISRFVRDFPHARLAIIITYHLGQAGLVLSLLR